MTPERAAELADDLRFKYAMSNAARDAIQQVILTACNEQKWEDADIASRLFKRSADAKAKAKNISERNKNKK